MEAHFWFCDKGWDVCSWKQWYTRWLISRSSFQGCCVAWLHQLSLVKTDERRLFRGCYVFSLFSGRNILALIQWRDSKQALVINKLTAVGKHLVAVKPAIFRQYVKLLNQAQSWRHGCRVIDCLLCLHLKITKVVSFRFSSKQSRSLLDEGMCLTQTDEKWMMTIDVIQGTQRTIPGNVQ